MVEDRGTYKEPVFAPLRHLRIAPVKYQFGAFLDCGLYPAQNKLLVPAIDDRAQDGALVVCRAQIDRLGHARNGFHQLVRDGVIGHDHGQRHAALPGAPAE